MSLEDILSFIWVKTHIKLRISKPLVVQVSPAGLWKYSAKLLKFP